MADQDSGSLLIVRHGEGRGRGPRFGAPFLEYLETNRPRIAERLRVWRTGAPLPDLEPVGAVLFWLADPLLELYPDCFREAEVIAHEARARGARIINPPSALSNSIKSRQAELWKAAGVPCASAVRFGDRDEFLTRIGTVEFPAIVRPDLLHAQEATYFCRTRQDAARLDPRALQYPGVILEFIDTRTGYSSQAPGSVWARWYHKKRCFVFGNRVVSNHILFGSRPIVGMDVCTFSRYAGRRRPLLPLLRFGGPDRAAIDADNGFWQQAPEAPDAMRHAARALTLDVVAIDYSTCSDGTRVFWEANPYFSLDRWDTGVLPIHRRLQERIQGFAVSYADFLEELLELPSRARSR